MVKTNTYTKYIIGKCTYQVPEVYKTRKSTKAGLKSLTKLLDGPKVSLEDYPEGVFTHCKKLVFVTPKGTLIVGHKRSMDCTGNLCMGDSNTEMVLFSPYYKSVVGFPHTCKEVEEKPGFAIAYPTLEDVPLKCRAAAIIPKPLMNSYCTYLVEEKLGHIPVISMEEEPKYSTIYPAWRNALSFCMTAKQYLRKVEDDASLPFID